MLWFAEPVRSENAQPTDPSFSVAKEGANEWFCFAEGEQIRSLIWAICQNGGGGNKNIDFLFVSPLTTLTRVP